jgi:hypothetical protein
MTKNMTKNARIRKSVYGNVDGLRLRRVLGRRDWDVPTSFGEDGWKIRRRDREAAVIVSCCEYDGAEWVHASMSRPDRMPTYDDLALLHRAAFGDDGWAYQVFAPPSEHINIHQYCLHLWGRLDGVSVLPNFGEYGSI